MNIFISVLIGLLFFSLTGNILIGGIIAVLFVIPLTLQKHSKKK